MVEYAICCCNKCGLIMARGVVWLCSMFMTRLDGNVSVCNFRRERCWEIRETPPLQGKQIPQDYSKFHDPGRWFHSWGWKRWWINLWREICWWKLQAKAYRTRYITVTYRKSSCTISNLRFRKKILHQWDISHIFQIICPPVCIIWSKVLGWSLSMMYLQGFCLWQMLVKTPMVPSSSSQP